MRKRIYWIDFDARKGHNYGTKLKNQLLTLYKDIKKEI